MIAGDIQFSLKLMCCSILALTHYRRYAYYVVFLNISWNEGLRQNTMCKQNQTVATGACRNLSVGCNQEPHSDSRTDLDALMKNNAL